MKFVSATTIFASTLMLFSFDVLAAKAEPKVQPFSCGMAMTEYWSKPDWCKTGASWCGIGDTDRFLLCMVPGGGGGQAGIDCRDLDSGNRDFNEIYIHVRSEDKSMLSGIRIIFECMVTGGAVKTFSVPISKLEVRDDPTGGYQIFASLAHVIDQMDRKPGRLRRMILVIESGSTIKTVSIGSIKIKLRTAGTINPKTMVMQNEGCDAIIIK